MPDVRYVRCDRPLLYEVDRLQRIARTDALDFILFDSAGYACAGKPEDAEAALAYFRAVRQIGPGSLHVAHITKGENNDQKPFGSSFWHNSARSTWFVKLAGTSADGQVTTVGMFNRKANLGPLRPPVAFDVSFSQEQTRFLRVDVSSVDELVTSLPLRERIRSLLKSGNPRTVATIAEELGAGKDSVEKALKRNTKLFTRVSQADGVHRFALVERRTA